MLRRFLGATFLARHFTCACAIAVSLTAAAAPGELDPTFANGGVLTLDFSYSKDFDARIAMRQGTDLVVAGTVPATDGSGPETVLTRIDRTGQLDTGFGQQGWKLLQNFRPACTPVSMAEVPQYLDIIVLCRTPDRLVFLSANQNGYTNEDSLLVNDAQIAVRADRSIYVAGTVTSGGQSYLVVSRFDATGYLDYTFGQSGRVYLMGSPAEIRVKAVTIDSSGALLVAGSWRDPAGSTGADMMVVRVLGDGTLDPAFGQGGMALADQAGLDDVANAIAIDAQGHIVVGGRAGDATLGGRFILWRLTAAGTSDSSFNGGGRFMPTLSPSIAYDSEVTALLLEDTGSITVVGPARRLSDGNVDFAVARVTSSGAPEPYFGFCDPPCSAFVGPAATESDEPLGVAGAYDSTFVIAGRRGGSTGTQVAAVLYDWRYGYPYYNGVVNAYRLSIVPPAGVEDVAVQSDSRIVVLGSVDGVTRVRRFLPNGAPDTGFGSNGEAVIEIEFENPVLQLQPDGKILVGAGGWFQPEVQRFLPDGTWDAEWGRRELVPGYALSLALQADGKLVSALNRSVPPPPPITGSYSETIVLTRLNADGTHDTSFGTNGEVVLDFRSGVYSLGAMQVYARPEGIYVVGNTRFLPWDPWRFKLTVWRFLASGALDPSWGDNGVAYASGRDDVAFGRALAFAGGKIYAAADCGQSTSATCFARFNGDGSLDASFGNAGVLEHQVFSYGDRTAAMEIDSHGLFVTAGSGNTGYAMRMYSNGQLDTTFNGTGVNAAATPGYLDTATLQPDGSLITGGYTNGTWVLSRIQGAGWDMTAPDTSITAGPSGTVASASASLSFASTEVGSTFECRLDASSFSACTPPAAYSGLADGVHTFEVRAVDAAGNIDATPAARTWTVDTTPPETAITSGPSGTVASHAADFAFSSSEGNSTFQCRLDTAAFAACTSPTSYSGLADGSHTFEVRALDAAGNVDATPASRTWTVDVTAPDTTITSSPAALSASASASFAFTATETGSSFECALDGGAFSSCTSPKPYAGLADGNHTFAVRAIDPAGNVDAAPAQFAWIIDTAAPDTTITSNPPALSATGSASFAFTATEAGSSFECALDGGAFSSCTSAKSYSGLAEGNHTFAVRATDPAGNVDATPAQFAWVIDSAAPDTTIIGGPSGTTASSGASFTFSATESGSMFQCSLDGAAWTACTSGVGYSGLADGMHMFEVRAIDAAGNVDPTPAQRSWSIDSAAPNTSITSGPAAVTNATDATFAFTATEAASFQCKLDAATYSACTSPATLSALPAGSHSFSVYSVDGAGNVDLSPATWSWVIDTTAPDTSFTSAPSGTVASASATLAFTSPDTGAVFECRIDGGAYAACTSPVSLSGLSEGSHSFGVRARDAAGNVDASPAVATWIVDTLAPDTTITSAPPAATNSTSATFVFSASEPATFECKLDAGAFAACTSPKSYTGLVTGSHTFEVRATDSVGHVDATPASATWTIDTTAPNTTITAGPSGSNNTQPVTFSFTSSESGGAFECKMDTGSFTACTSPASYSGLAKGNHTFQVRAIDAAGNVDASPASRSFGVK